MRRVIAVTKAYIVVLLCALVVVTWALVLGSRPVSSDPTPVRVLIARGTPASGIATVLKDQGLIRSPFVFSLTCVVSGMSDKLKPGVYEFRHTMSVPQIISALVAGESLEQWVTIPEGFTVRQIADLLQEKQLADGYAVLRLALEQGYSFPRYAFIHSRSLEGYLFPDSYLVARGTSPEGILDRLLATFEAKVVKAHRARIERVCASRFGLGEDRFALGLHRIVTLASMVEREAKTASDRPLVAAVLWNRLKKGMKLEVDATVTYAPGESTQNKARIYYKDLESESPYNTYKHFGLPPGPICNPGLASIEAVLEPANADYLYYVARKDGSHIFSRTFEEHRAASDAVRAQER